MCLMLYAVLPNKLSELPQSAKSPYLSISEINLSNDLYNISSLFPDKQLYFIGTEEGCSCKFSIPKGLKDSDYESLPKDLITEIIESSKKDIQRMNDLRMFCEDLISQTVDNKIELYGYWIGEELKLSDPVLYNIQSLFNPENFYMEDKYYILSRN
ncbi:hypothetical protein [Serpentinicella alkaliphila]|uniref:Uncharacterized protein n=1 Tax=Serpentinicella alkaliphila TaxID=1734049 RepID=A0A4R2TEW0_9FIRM|nr:hypothetical protein [Serpentinicella alkaliphila]QUH26143.1 hypothetical protein HZR23_10610 [Serpentinicella alkaliphila]TCP93242.1 hypothetical protein EDD79_10863 [Serpentinicella alkaliphila]